MKNKRLLYMMAGVLVALGFSASALFGQGVEFFLEDFETDGDGSRYTVIAAGDDGENAYVARRQDGTAGTRISNPPSGTWMFGFNDVDDAPGDRGSQFPGEDMTGREGRIKIHDVDVSGTGKLRISLWAGIGRSPGTEPDNDFRIRIRFDDGEWQEVGGFKSAASNSRMIYYPGPADTMTVALSPEKLFNAFSQWSWDIQGHGSQIDIDLTMDSNHLLENIYIDDVRLTGNTDVGLYTMAFDNVDVTEPADDGSVSNTLTITLDEPAPAGGVEVHLSTSERGMSSLVIPGEPVVIAAGATSAQVTIDVVQDGTYSGTKTLRVNGSAVGYNNEFAPINVTNVSPVPNIVITEAMNANPGSFPEETYLDANGDGFITNGDKFLEIVNFGDTAVDINGWRVGDDLADRHLIGVVKDAVLEPNTAYVVFTGEADSDPRGVFGGAIVEEASGGGNGLAFNSLTRTETPYIAAPFGAIVDRVQLPTLAAEVASLMEALPEGHPGKGLIASWHSLEKAGGEIDREWTGPNLHSEIAAAGERVFSPGTWVDGTPYFTVENSLSLSVDNPVINEDSGSNAATGTITLDSPAGSGGLDVTLSTTGLIVESDGSLTPDEIDLDSLMVTVPEGNTSATFRIGAHNDGVLDGDKTFGIGATAGAYVLPGSVEITVEDTEVSDLDVVINEVLNDAEATATDFNQNGTPGEEVGDQFVEIVNNMDRAVNLSGWKVTWNTKGVFASRIDMHTFAQGMWVPAGGSIVVFGTITSEQAANAAFEGAIVVQAKLDDGTPKPDGIGIGITGEEADPTWEVELFNNHGFRVDHWDELAVELAAQAQSVTRSPDITGDVDLHLEAALPHLSFATGSPGKQVDEAAFAGNGTIFLPLKFINILYVDDDGLHWDPSFGWMDTTVAPTVETGFVYSWDVGTWWYIHPASFTGNLWLYDYDLGAWLYSSYVFYPWVYNYTSGAWQSRI